TPTDIRNFRDERGRSDFDRTQVLTAASVWELPFGRGKRFLKSSPGVVNQVLCGWTVNAIYTFQSGEPFSVRSGSFTSNGNHQSRAGVQIYTPAQLQILPGTLLVGPVVFPQVVFNPVTPLPSALAFDLIQSF